MSDEWDNLNDRSSEREMWSTDNMGEAAPGVLSPLGWSVWGEVGERSVRSALFRMGVLGAEERPAPTDPDQRVLRVFCGRMAMQMQLLATIGNRMPGTSGQQVVEGILGRVPDELDFTATRARYPAIAVRLPKVAVLTPGQVRRLAADTDAWWRANAVAASTWHREEAVAGLRAGVERFEHTLTLHTTCLMACVQPADELLGKLVERAGVGDVALLSGSGGAEMAVVADIWRVSRGELTVQDVAARHGFHGPLEGELSSHVWREDSAPLEAMAARYAAEPDSAAPAELEHRRHAAALAARRAVLAAVPARERPAARAVLALAARRIPMRGVGKRSFLQSLDVTRASARRLGVLLHADSHIDHPDDAFYLTWRELAETLPDNARALVELRRERRANYQELTLPGSWTGTPVPLVDRQQSGVDVDTITGIAASAGVVEGRVRVLLSPDFEAVEPDEILVAPTTDPSWSSVMFISAGLVVDIGSRLSHAAVVARELGLPCVVNTRGGTRDLRTGDLVRVDGTAGTVHVLARA